MSAPLIPNTGVVLAGFNVYTATKTLTNAQTLALPTTPIAFIVAPGAGKRIMVIKGVWRATTTSGAYTNINGSCLLRLVYGANVTRASEQMLAANVTTLLGGTSIQSAPLHYWQEAPEAIANVENLAVNISIDNNGAGVLTGGNAADSLVVTAHYLVIG